MRNVSAVFAFFLLAAQDGIAADVNVIGLTSGKAVLIIDGGKPRTLSVGETAPGNVKLISASTEAAVVEIAGKRQTLVLGQRISMGSGTAGTQRVTLSADAQGHFFTTATINGLTMRFLVDTGASLVTISSDDARRAGIPYLSGQRALLQTANGIVPAYRVKLDTVRLGEITLHNIDGIVVDGNPLGGHGLLGMSFLNRTEMRREGDSMTLTRRY